MATRAEKIRAIPRKRITVSIDLTPEEYRDLILAVIAKRRQRNATCAASWRVPVIEPTDPNIHYAVAFDVKCELHNVILKLIGHEGSPTFAARVRQIIAEEEAEELGLTLANAA